VELIQVQHLNFTYPGQQQAALKDVSLTIEQGDFFVLCGYSGSGKSTLLRHFKPALTPHGTCTGAVFLKDTPVGALSAADAASKIGYVQQSPEQQVVTDKVWHELAFGLESLGMETEVIRRRTSEMAAFFGMEDWYYKNVSELSGGQKQLLNLASVMVMQPEVLILDEPTAQLDPIAASEFLDILKKINQEIGTTIILSEHRLEEALALASKAAMMEAGRVLFCDTVQELGQFLKDTGNPMFFAMPTAMQVWGSVDSAQICPVTVGEGRRFLTSYVKAHPLQQNLEKHMDVNPGKELLRMEDVWFRYEKNQSDVAAGLSLSAHAGALFCILGGNGSGKTTTLKLLAGTKKPYRGNVIRRGRVGFLPQNPQALFVKKTVAEDLADVFDQKTISSDEQEQAIMKVADLCHLSELLFRHPYDLSGGEQQRVALAKVLLLQPEILLLDEPTKGLDVIFKRELARILQHLKNQGVCIVMVSHDLEFCAGVSDRCGLFFGGSIVTEGTPEAFFSGNSFYTTAANRMGREVAPEVVTTEGLIRRIGGKTLEFKYLDEQKQAETTETGNNTASVNSCKSDDKTITGPSVFENSKNIPLPRGRKIAAALSGAAALGIYLYAAKTEKLSSLVDGNGLTGIGTRQLLLYGGFIAALLLLAAALARPVKTNIQEHSQIEKRKISKRTRLAALMILLLIPLTLFAGFFYMEQKQYYVTAMLVLLECMAPFFMIFEGRHPKARELVVIASLCALAVAGRAAFFMLPEFKPVMAITIITGVALGGETGFLVGAVSMLVSNMFFSQGPWTPWQMFAMGIIGFLAGVLYKKGLLARTRCALCSFGMLCALLIYGGIMNPASALLWGSEALNFKILLTYYVTGFPMDLIHAAATALFLWFGAEPLLEKLDRIKVKYGLME
jgi:energy-coupling factor transport system ATP-binding protein